MKKYDAIIIGFGKGGKTLAAEFAKRQKTVAIVERSDRMYGGTCINIGCIPTKTLVHLAKETPVKATWEEKKDYYRQAIGRKEEVTSFLRNKNYHNLADNPNVTVYTGVGSFAGPDVVEVRTEAEVIELQSSQIFINTGAETIVPPIDGIKENPRVYTSTSIMELEELPSEASRTTQLFPQTPDLQLKDVTFSYSTGDRPILNHFSCNFPAGSCTAVLGETGAGKTTLIRLLLALATPQEGSITLSPANTAQPPLSTLNFQLSTLEVSPQTRSNFVYVPQGNTLFSGTIHDNLLMGNPHATEAQMLQALRTACADFVLSLPDGIDTNLNEQGGGLSEGQAQRIAIARALLRPGHILLLDEATSALDPETERQLIKNLRRDCTGKTFIFITHHPAVAEACEATIQL